MSFLRFYDGAVPGKKRKTEETNGARKNKGLFNLIKQRKVQLYEMVFGYFTTFVSWVLFPYWFLKMKGKASMAIGEICTVFSRSCKSNEGPVKFTCYWTSWPVKKFRWVCCWVIYFAVNN